MSSCSAGITRKLRLSALLSRNELLFMMGYTKKCEYAYAFDMTSEVSLHARGPGIGGSMTWTFHYPVTGHEIIPKHGAVEETTDVLNMISNYKRSV